MKRLILIFAVLVSSVSLVAQNNNGKKPIILSPGPGTIYRPTDLASFSPTLYAEYDEDSLSISISDYWGDVEVFIMSSVGHQMMDDEETTVVSQAQLDFSLGCYTSGASYQIYVVLENGEVYMGEFQCL